MLTVVVLGVAEQSTRSGHTGSRLAVLSTLHIAEFKAVWAKADHRVLLYARALNMLLGGSP